MKYPIGIQSFDQLIEDGYVYIDKTDLVEKDWNVYPVFHVDFNSTNFSNPGELEEKLNFYVSEWERKYGLYGRYDTLGIGDRFAEVIRVAHETTGRRAVVLIDEYDKPVLDVLDVDSDLEDRHRNFLKVFYSVFKGADAHLQFVLLTGVTKFSQVSVFSGFNQPKDISLDARYETLCGITQEEMEIYFHNSIEKMATEYQCTSDEIKVRLKEKYDGYHFSKRMTDVYNPFSLLNAFDRVSMENYWFSTGTPTYLIRLLSHFRENMNELTGKYYRQEEFVDYKADVERPLPMIYQSGYLTIKDYDMRRDRFLLDFPNNEVKSGFIIAVASSYLNPHTHLTGWIDDVVDAMEAGEPDTLRELFTSFLASIPLY